MTKNLVFLAVSFLVQNVAQAAADRPLACAFPGGFTVSGDLLSGGEFLVKNFTGAGGEFFVVGTLANQIKLSENPILSQIGEGTGREYPMNGRVYEYSPERGMQIATGPSCVLRLPVKVPQGQIPANYECQKYDKGVVVAFDFKGGFCL